MKVFANTLIKNIKVNVIGSGKGKGKKLNVESNLVETNNIELDVKKIWEKSHDGKGVKNKNKSRNRIRQENKKVLVVGGSPHTVENKNETPGGAVHIAEENTCNRDLLSSQPPYF